MSATDPARTRAPFSLGGRALALGDILKVARGQHEVTLSEAAAQRVREGHESLRRLVGKGARIYGLTTGVGAMDATHIDVEQSERAQRAFLRSHAAGMGEELSADVVRAGMLVRANQLCAGQSGIQEASLRAYLRVLSSRFVPRVPEAGSLGAADLCSLAQIALLLVGEGRARLGDKLYTGAELVRDLQLDAQLAWRDGFALVASPAMSTGLGALVCHDALALIEHSEAACALHVVAEQSMRSSWDQLLVDVVPHAGAVESARRMRELLTSSLGSNAGVRETLSTRSAHRVHGAARDAVATVEATVLLEANAAIDNPVLLGGDEFSNNAANFHAQELAQCLDTLGTSLIAMAVATERRVAKLQLAGPQGHAFLSDGAGEHAGSMIVHYTAAALLAELRMLAIPAATQSIPVCNGSEDIAPMCWLAARRAQRILALCQQLTAIELWTAHRAMAMRELVCPAQLQALYERLGAGRIDDERCVAEQVEDVLAWLRDDRGA